jgi:hypothetical protein
MSGQAKVLILLVPSLASSTASLRPRPRPASVQLAAAGAVSGGQHG